MQILTEQESSLYDIEWILKWVTKADAHSEFYSQGVDQERENVQGVLEFISPVATGELLARRRKEDTEDENDDELTLDNN